MNVLQATVLSVSGLVHGLVSSSSGNLNGGGAEIAATREYFYAGGRYVNVTSGNATDSYMVGQIYVEKLTPLHLSQKFPIIFIPGAGQTGTNFLNTPDGRQGWASYFLSRGYTVFLTDQPERGRSFWLPSHGTMAAFSVEQLQQLFTDPESYNRWPQASLHTQWSGSGRAGDVIFDALMASQVQYQSDRRLSEENCAQAYAALLDQMGPAYILTHSQSGQFGWRIGDARPQLVKGIMALEPAGPPFVDKYPFSGTRLFGITEGEVAYEPSAGPNAAYLFTVTIPAIDVNHTECILQANPAKKLKNLSQVPVLIVTSEASYHAPYDYCTAQYLEQAGVDTTFLDLAKADIHGNGHMMFMEKNNLGIAERVHEWLNTL